MYDLVEILTQMAMSLGFPGSAWKGEACWALVIHLGAGRVAVATCFTWAAGLCRTWPVWTNQAKKTRKLTRARLMVAGALPWACK